MSQRVFVKVVGFADVERHALNSLFHLSQEHDIEYSLWEPGAPEEPGLALIDGQSWEAGVLVESPRNAELRFIWFGKHAPLTAWRSFDRPISWTEVVQAMDELFMPLAPGSHPLDFDAVDTLPPVELPRKRALIASADRDERLYMRAKLSLADLTHADEAESGAQALELVRDTDYDVALIDFALPDLHGWEFLKELAGARRRIPHVIVTKTRASLAERMRARLVGIEGFFDKPPDPARLHELLQRV